MRGVGGRDRGGNSGKKEGAKGGKWGARGERSELSIQGGGSWRGWASRKRGMERKEPKPEATNRQLSPNQRLSGQDPQSMKCASHKKTTAKFNFQKEGSSQVASCKVRQPGHAP